MADLMCEECEQAETLGAIYMRKANRYGWRPPAETTTAPRYDNAANSLEPISRGGVTCAEIGEMNGVE
jgi:hypothetical protein